jgi:hypothetical protein
MRAKMNLGIMDSKILGKIHFSKSSRIKKLKINLTKSTKKPHQFKVGKFEKKIYILQAAKPNHRRIQEISTIPYQEAEKNKSKKATPAEHF